MTNKVWFKTDTAGRPLGVYMYYNGNWRKVYTGVGIGEIRMWSGISTVFDGTGLGVVAGDLDGWALCNGQNGTPNLANRFVVGSSAYSNIWTANPDGTGANYVGGTGQIQCVNLPDLWATGYAANVQNGTGNTLVLSNDPAAGQPMAIQIKDLINNCQPAGQRPLVPPWYALAYIEFVGYA